MRCIGVQSPAGVWNPSQLIGANVRIVSSPIGSCLFGYDHEEIHEIVGIGFRVNRLGKAYTVFKLGGINGEFPLRDLEIVSLSFYFRPIAECNVPKCGTTLCGWKVDQGYVEEDGDNLSDPGSVEVNVGEEDGEILD